MKNFTKLLAIGAVVAMLGIVILPRASFAQSAPGIADNAILIKATSSNSVRITWTTSMPTTTTLSYVENGMMQNAAV